MKLQFRKNDLSEGLNIVSKAVSAKTTLPILSCILIDAAGDSIRLTGNDNEIAIETSVKGIITEPGRIAVDARLFTEIIRKLPDGVIRINAENEVVTILCEKAHFTISGRRGEDFPALPSVETNEYLCMSQFTLKEMIRQTIFSISANDNNKLMTGEYIEVNGSSMKIAALDGHRIAIRNIELKEDYGSHRVIVPGKTLVEISRILPGGQEDEVTLFFSRNYILFEFGETVVLSRLIDGEYFKIDKMISRDYETKIQVNRRELLEAIDRSILLVRETDKKPIVFRIEDGTMELSMNSVIGAMHESIGITQEGGNILIGFNPRFLADALRVIDDEEVTIYMMNSKAPCFIRDAEDQYIYLILPINIAQ